MSDADLEVLKGLLSDLRCKRKALLAHPTAEHAYDLCFRRIVKAEEGRRDA